MGVIITIMIIIIITIIIIIIIIIIITSNVIGIFPVDLITRNILSLQ